MTGSSATSTASPLDGSIVTSLDRLVTAFRLWIEDRLPWYDRQAEQQASARTEDIRRRSIGLRIRAEALIAEQRLRHR
jgi:hypothetical protein